MRPPELEFRNGAVYLPALRLWLDAQEPQLGPERVFVSHAHSDHVAAHREVILSTPTSRLMQARVPGERYEHVLQFGEPLQLESHQQKFEVTLLPAGHIFGSAMALIRTEGNTLLYTGDFKLRRGLSAEPCEPHQADVLIMETTFGRPQYVFPPTESVMQGVIRFCREAIDNDETPVLLGYSLGKSQEVLCSLGEAGLPLVLHGTVYRLTKIYEQFGQCFPAYERYEAEKARGKVLICPPSVVNSPMLRNLGKTRTAILTGWAVDPGCRYRYQCDAAFPLSDHADHPDLVEFVKRVAPKRVYTLHGFAADFAQQLRDMGIDARALSQQEQFELRLETKGADATQPPAVSRGQSDLQGVEVRYGSEGATPGNSFQLFAQTCAQVGAQASKLEKIRLLAGYLRLLRGQSVGWAATWFSGRPFPASQNKVLQLGWAVLRDALRAVTRVDSATFHHVYLKHSDLGETTAELLATDRAAGLTLAEVADLFQRLHASRSPLAKVPQLAEALRACSAIEAKYLVKIITGDLRIGLKEGLVEEAIAQAYGAAPDAVRHAHLLLGDISETAILAAEGRLDQASLVPFRPVKVMLASPEPTAEDIWNRVRETHIARGLAAEGPAFQVWIEDKYDGIRCQMHKAGNRAGLYSRDSKDITATFPEMADALRSLRFECILDGEVVAMRGRQILPFAELQKRLGRREGDLFMREEVPIKFVVFDLLWLNGRTCLSLPLKERRATLEALQPWPDAVLLARITRATSPQAIEDAFAAARDRDNEGLMIKDPESPYTPGRRGLAWLKLKKAFATLDCVVVGAEFGHGRRSKVLSDYTFAVRDEASGSLKVIGKAYSGLTDVEIERMTRHFLSTALRQHGRYFEVPPDTVLEIAFDRIQPSTRHNSGLALRFPRIVRIRADKTPQEIDSLGTARRLAGLDR